MGLLQIGPQHVVVERTERARLGWIKKNAAAQEHEREDEKTEEKYDSNESRSALQPSIPSPSRLDQSDDAFFLCCYLAVLLRLAPVAVRRGPLEEAASAPFHPPPSPSLACSGVQAEASASIRPSEPSPCPLSASGRLLAVHGWTAYRGIVFSSQEIPTLHHIPPLSFFTVFSNGIQKLDRAIALILIFAQISLPLFTSSAIAVLYSPDTKVPRTGELALRKAIPANANMKVIQDSLEDISYLLRIPQRKPYGSMEGDVRKALKIAMEEKESILSSIPEESKEEGSLLYASLIDGKGGLQNLIGSIKEKDPDKVSVGLASSLDTLAQLELLQAPGLSFLLPGQYLTYPRLTGRGMVEFTIEKPDGSTFFPNAGGEPTSLATIQLVIDGYSAPLTAGNFAKLVMDGAYDGVKLRCATQAVLSDNELEKNGYSVPLEIMPSGQFEPLYKTTLSVQDGELPVLPLSVYGAVAMARSVDSDEFSSPSQFFFYLYDKRSSGLGGLSFDEGQFSVFGYTTVGREVLQQIKTGDVIRSAKLVQGRDRLILPDGN